MNKFSKNDTDVFFDYEIRMFRQLGINPANFCKIGYGVESYDRYCKYYGKIETDRIYGLSYNWSAKDNGNFCFFEVDKGIKYTIWEILNGKSYFDSDFFSVSNNFTM